MKNPTWTKIYNEAKAANDGRLINGLTLVTDPDVMEYVNARDAAVAVPCFALFGVALVLSASAAGWM